MSANWNITDDNGGGKGLPVRSRRGPIGVTWWAQRWLGLFEANADHQEVDLGRRLARQSRVLELTVTPGEIQARVEESHQRVFAVGFTAPALTETQQRLLVAAIVRDNLALAMMYAERLPENLETLFATADARLFPDKDLGLACSCGGKGPACRHLLAAASVAAERFDVEPFLLLAWRGLDQPRFMGKVRQLWGAPPLPKRRTEATVPIETQMTSFHRCPVELPTNSGSVELPALNALECLGEPPFFPPNDGPPVQTLGDLYSE